MKRSFFKYGVMAVMMLVAGFTFTACGDDEDDPTEGVVTPGGDEDGDGEENTSPIASASVVYSVQTANFADMQAVADEIYVRYVDENNQVRQEPFTGKWEKNVEVPAVDGSCTVALQVIGVAKDDESLAALSGDIRLRIDASAVYGFNHVDGGKSDGWNLSAAVNNSYALPDGLNGMLNDFNSDKEKFGGIVFASCAQNDGGEHISPEAFWETNKFVPGE